MALNLLPEIAYPALTILTDYEDAAPEEIENLISRPIEEVVGVVGGLSRVESVSRSGQSEVVLEFTWRTNMDVATLEVREKLDLAAVAAGRRAAGAVALRSFLRSRHAPSVLGRRRASAAFAIWPTRS